MFYNIYIIFRSIIYVLFSVVIVNLNYLKSSFKKVKIISKIIKTKIFKLREKKLKVRKMTTKY